MRIKSVSLAIAALAAAAAPAVASAQSYGYGYSQNYGTGAYGRPYDYSYGRPTYQYCDSERQGRTGAGALIGGGAGAVVGSQLAARGRRTEGSILGGVVGALIGSQVGRSSSNACESYHYSGYDQPAYGQPTYSYSQPSYGYYDDRYAGDQGYDYYRDDPRDDYYDRGRPVESYRNSDGCRLAESEIRLPDGRRDVRYVRTCPDASGRYRVVD